MAKKMLTSREAVMALPDRDLVHVMWTSISKDGKVYSGSKTFEWSVDVLFRAEKIVTASSDHQKKGHGIEARLHGSIYWFETAQHSTAAAGVAYAEALR